ncbi:hypothetical protein [Bacillus cereus]|nr:hypothetical protein [Bacillus cereus]
MKMSKEEANLIAKKGIEIRGKYEFPGRKKEIVNMNKNKHKK